jgi:uncharacterized protein YkwD
MLRPFSIYLLRWIFFLFIIVCVSAAGVGESLFFVKPSEQRVPTPTIFQKIKSSTNTQRQEGKIIVPKETEKNGGQTTQSEAWGVAKQIDEHTWTMQVGDDEQMASPQEILNALNAYRQQHGSGSLIWDVNLTNYANERAKFFVATGTLDGHAGFSEYVNNQDGFTKLGFASLGENSSFGYRLSGVHLIEWVYAGDVPHNTNQLNSKWKYVGIGVNENATDLVFGGEKL